MGAASGLVVRGRYSYEGTNFMSLRDLRQHYSPERPVEERLRLLEVAITHLPAPEFLWLGVAQEALSSAELPLRRAAMRLLAFAPQTWDQVLVAGLTTEDAELQRVALAALATQARAWPELIDAYRALGELPGWLPESLAIWEQATAMLVPPAAPAEAESAESQARLAEAQGQLSALGAERDRLQARLAEAEAEAARAREAAASLGSRLGEAQLAAAELENSLESERRGAKDLAGRLERLIAVQDTDADARRRAVDDYERLRQRHRLVMMGSAAVVAVLVLVGGPVTWTLGSHTGTAQAGAVMAAAPTAPAESELEAAEEAGYRRALAGLADRANKLSTDGHLYPAVTTWQAYAQLAPTPSEAQQAVQQSDALLARIQRGPAARPAQAAAPKPRVATPSRVSFKQQPARRLAPRQAASQPKANDASTVRVAPPALPTPAAAPAIPDAVRAKF
jgi:hypothetical protein